MRTFCDVYLRMRKRAHGSVVHCFDSGSLSSDRVARSLRFLSLNCISLNSFQLTALFSVPVHWPALSIDSACLRCCPDNRHTHTVATPYPTYTCTWRLITENDAPAAAYSIKLSATVALTLLQFLPPTLPAGAACTPHDATTITLTIVYIQLRASSHFVS